MGFICPLGVFWLQNLAKKNCIMGQKGEKKTEQNTLKSKTHPSLFVNARRHNCKGEGTISEDVCVLFKQALAQRFESKMQTGRTQERGSVGPVVLRDLMQMWREVRRRKGWRVGVISHTHTQKKKICIYTCYMYAVWKKKLWSFKNHLHKFFITSNIGYVQLY